MSAFAASSRVERKASTRSWGSLFMKPTVSEISTSVPLGRSACRTTGSSVANSISSASTDASVRALSSVDLPALV